MGAGASAQLAADKTEKIALVRAFLSDGEKVKAVWSALDFNGNGLVSVAETDKFIGENQDNFDGFFKPVVNATTGKPKQRVLIRAWKKCTGRAYSSHDDGFIHKHEFRVFIRYIMFYNDMAEVFTEIDEEGSEDKRLSKDEFVAGGVMLFHGNGKTVEGTDIPEEELAAIKADLEKTFSNIDTNGGGFILFDEFCHYACCVADA